jgi:predicted lysophospholipase L1 biosynthesis ABC-type transport system permease subunit
VKEGRSFAEQDDADAPLTIMINETFARRYFAGRNPVGLNVSLWGRERTIVGVAADGKYRQLNEPATPWIYVNQKQRSHRTLTLVVRSKAPVSVLRRSVEEMTTRIDPTLAPVAALPFADFIGAAWVVPRMAASLLSALGMVAWLLAVLGVYAVVSQQVLQRTRELAVRVALGAQPHTIFQSVMKLGVQLSLPGLLLGAVAGLFLGRALGSFLVGIGPGDWISWVTTFATLLLATLGACWWPARRATRVDPMEALRHE